MAQKNDATTLILALLISGGLISAGLWRLTRNTSLSNLLTSNSSPSSFVAPNSTTTQPLATNFNTFTEVPSIPNGLCIYGGSTTCAPIRQVINPEIPSIFPQFQLRYFQNPSQAPGSGAGIQQLIVNPLTFATS